MKDEGRGQESVIGKHGAADTNTDTGKSPRIFRRFRRLPVLRMLREAEHRPTSVHKVLQDSRAALSGTHFRNLG